MGMLRARLTLILAGVFALQGCAAVVVAGAATTVALVAHDRRTTGTIIDDNNVEFAAYHAFSEDEQLAEQAHINVTSFNGIVLLTGMAASETDRERAARIVSEIPKVREVHNEILVAGPSSTLTRSSDGLITTKVKAKMMTSDDVDPTRIKVTTENGTVYLMGIVTRDEAASATEVTRGVSGVQRVVKLFEYTE